MSPDSDVRPIANHSHQSVTSVKDSPGAHVVLDFGKALDTISTASRISALAVLGLIAVSYFAYTHARETRMLEYYIVETDAKLINAGVISFKDSWSYRKSHPNDPPEKDKKP